MNHITDLIKRLRVLYLLSPKQLALLLNVSVHTYKAIEDGLFSVSPEIVVMLSQIYRIPLDYFKMDSPKDALNQIEISNDYKSMGEQERFLAISYNLVGVGTEKDLNRRIRNKKRQILLEIQSNPSVGTVFTGSEDQIGILAKLGNV
jgi:transcriptional regulator with XRE-family HTH domain